MICEGNEKQHRQRNTELLGRTFIENIACFIQEEKPLAGFPGIGNDRSAVASTPHRLRPRLRGQIAEIGEMEIVFVFMGHTTFLVLLQAALLQNRSADLPTYPVLYLFHLELEPIRRQLARGKIFPLIHACFDPLVPPVQDRSSLIRADVFAIFPFNNSPGCLSFLRSIYTFPFLLTFAREFRPYAELSLLYQKQQQMRV